MKVVYQMPRVEMNRKKYMIADLPGWISGRMKKKKIRQKDIAEEINITQPAFSHKLWSGRDLFTYGDLITLFDKLDATDEEILSLMKLHGNRDD